MTQKFSRYFGFFTEKSSYVPTCLLVHCVCAATATDAGADIFVATAKIHILRVHDVVEGVCSCVF